MDFISIVYLVIVTVAKELIGKVKNWESYTWREQQYLEVIRYNCPFNIFNSYEITNSEFIMCNPVRGVTSNRKWSG